MLFQKGLRLDKDVLLNYLLSTFLTKLPIKRSCLKEKVTVIITVIAITIVANFKENFIWKYYKHFNTIFMYKFIS